MNNSYQKFVQWLHDHPFIGGLLVAVESSGYAALVAAWSDDVFSKAGFKRLLISVGTAIFVGVRMYIKQAPRKPWTQQQREDHALAAFDAQAGKDAPKP